MYKNAPLCYFVLNSDPAAVTIQPSAPSFPPDSYRPPSPHLTHHPYMPPGASGINMPSTRPTPGASGVHMPSPYVAPPGARGAPVPYPQYPSNTEPEAPPPSYEDSIQIK